MVACGPPTVTDISGDPSIGDDDDGGGDDDDGEVTTIPTGTTPPGGSPGPTLTNVPSFATWDAQIRTATACAATCHNGSAGFFYYRTDSIENRRSSWFSAICNRIDLTPNG